MCVCDNEFVLGRGIVTLEADFRQDFMLWGTKFGEGVCVPLKVVGARGWVEVKLTCFEQYC